MLLGILDADPALLADRCGQILIGDKNYYGHDFETTLAESGVRLLRPARQGEPERPGAHLFKPLRQIIEAIHDTLKGQLDLEQHGAPHPASSSASCSASLPSPPRSGTTTTSADR